MCRFLLLVLNISVILSIVQSKELWNLEKSGLIHKTRSLSGVEFTNRRLEDIEEKFFATIPNDNVINLKEGDEVSFHIPSSDGFVNEGCLLKNSITGIPKLRTNQVRVFSCITESNGELNIVVTEAEDTYLSGTFYSDIGRTYYIDIATKGSEDYILYDTRRQLVTVTPSEHYEDFEIFEELETTLVESVKLQEEVGENDIFKYNLAVLTSFEFAQRHGNSVAGVSSFIVSTVARVNGIYLRQLSAFFELVEDFDIGICVSSDVRQTCIDVENNLLAKAPTKDRLEVLGVPFDSYDVALVFVAAGSGGSAGLDTLCSGNKHNNLVDGPSGPLTEVDFFAVFMLAHELGHIMGSGHTLRDCGVFINDSGNLSPDQAVEPGSGSTLMSLGGATCPGATNIVQTRDAYIHSKTREIVRDRLITKHLNANCGVLIRNNVNQPEVQTPETCFVPLGNKFMLNGRTTTTNSNSAYGWERVDPGQEDYADNGGRFRSFPPIRNRKDRFFPNLQYANFFLDTDFELLPKTARSMTFRFAERSNFILDSSLDSLVNSAAGTFTSADTVVEFKNEDRFSVNALASSEISLNEGFSVDWSVGSLLKRSPDQKIQIFFAENTMETVEQLFKIDYETDVDDLDWKFMKEVDLADENVCLEVPDSFVDLNRLDSFQGNILFLVTSNQNARASVRNDGNCFVYEIFVNLTFTERSKDNPCIAGEQQAQPATTALPVLLPGDDIFNTGDEDEDEDDGDNEEGGSAAGVVIGILSVLLIGGVVGAVVYKKRQTSEGHNFNDNMSLNSKKPKATPLKNNQRWSASRRGNNQLDVEFGKADGSKSSRFDGIKSTFASTLSRKKKPEVSEQSEVRSSEGSVWKKSLASGLDKTKGAFASASTAVKTKLAKKKEIDISEPSGATADNGRPKAQFSRQVSEKLQQDPFPDPAFAGVESKGKPRALSREVSRKLQRDPFPDPNFTPNTLEREQKKNKTAKWGASIVGSVNKFGFGKKATEDDEDVVRNEGPKLNISTPTQGKSSRQSNRSFIPSMFREQKTAPRPPLSPPASKSNFQMQKSTPRPPKSAPKQTPFQFQKTAPKKPNFVIQKSTPRTPKVKPTKKKSEKKGETELTGVAAMRARFEKNNRP